MNRPASMTNDQNRRSRTALTSYALVLGFVLTIALFQYRSGSTNSGTPAPLLALRKLVQAGAPTALRADDATRFHIPHHVMPRVQGPVNPAIRYEEQYDHKTSFLPSKAVHEQHAIPRVIYQSWLSDAVGPQMGKAMSSWMELNPEYEYIFLTDDVAENYASTWMEVEDPNESEYTSRYHRYADVPPHFSNPNSKNPAVINFVPNQQCPPVEDPAQLKEALYLSPEEIKELRELYERLTIGASKADLIRLMLIYELGGVWFDADTACVRPLREWVHPSATYVTGRGGRGDLMQWGLIAAPRHPIIGRTLRLVLQGTRGKSIHELKLQVEALAGPPVLWTAALDVICSPATVGAVTSRMSIFSGDEFNNRAQFKMPGVDDERISEGFRHWAQEMTEAIQQG